MAALTTDQIETIRDDVGSDASIGELQRVYDRVGTVAGTAATFLRRRLADLLARPASFTIPGEYGENRAANIKALQDRLAVLDAAASAEAGGSLPTVVIREPATETTR